MKKLYFSLMHYLVGKIARTFGAIHAPWTHKQISYKDVLEASNYLKCGDIILSRTHGEFTTIMIPGYWKHAALYIGDDMIIDATGIGVAKRHLADLMMHTDNIVILRVQDISVVESELMCDKAHTFLGLPYDFEMDAQSQKALFCSELVMHCINFAKKFEYIEPRESMGIPTFTPQDCYNATKKFYKIWEKLQK